MAQIVTVKNGTTNEIQYPRTVKSALLNDDGTPLNPLTGLELDTKVDKTAIVNDLTTGGATKVLSAEQGKVLQNAIAGINVNGGDADTVDGKHASDFLASVKGNGVQANDLGVATELRWRNYGQGHTIIDGSQGLTPNGVTVPKDNSQFPWGINYPILMGWNGSNTYGIKVDTSRTSDLVKGRDLCTEVDGLKSSVVNGKQAVVNAINGSLGYASGLTTNHTHDDYAWWIQNKVGVSTSMITKFSYYKNGNELYNAAKTAYYTAYVAASSQINVSLTFTSPILLCLREEITSKGNTYGWARVIDISADRNAVLGTMYTSSTFDDRLVLLMVTGPTTISFNIGNGSTSARNVTEIYTLN